jgi:hypothetical protein
LDAVRFTLDHNCLIAIEKQEQPTAACLRSLIARHDAGEAEIRLVATSASERQQGTIPCLRDFGDFRARVARLGLGHLELLTPILTLDVSFLGWSILAADEDIALMEQLHRVLFPGQPFHFKDAVAAAGPGADPDIVERKWRNRLLDVQALWCHIHYGGDVFVTSDGRFRSQQKREPLAALGAANVLRPCHALSVIPGSAASPASTSPAGSTPLYPEPQNRQSSSPRDHAVPAD